MKKNISKSKIFLALISLLITFFVWQQGLKDSLNRPSVSFDISQKEKEITELALPAIPSDLRNFFVVGDPIEEIEESLSRTPFDELTERNKLIFLISTYQKEKFPEYNFIDENYKSVLNYLKEKSVDDSYSPSDDWLNKVKKDPFLYNVLNKKFNFNDDELIINPLSERMFFKIIAIKFIPLFTIIIGSILVLKTFRDILVSKKIPWREFKPLDLHLIDMVLLIAGGFVVLGEVISPLISITIVELFSGNFSTELNQALKIFFGYIFMAIPPLLIVYYQIKSLDGKFLIKKDYLEFNYYRIKGAIIQGFRGWLMIIPFVLLVSLIMNLLINNQNGSNPLLEIVLNNSNNFSFILLFLTTTLLAPFFEEIIFRGVLLPILSRDFGIVIGISTSAFIFALAHLSIGEMPPLFVLGIGLGITRLVSGSLISSIIMHSLWNGLTFLNLFLLRT